MFEDSLKGRGRAVTSEMVAALNPRLANEIQRVVTENIEIALDDAHGHQRAGDLAADRIAELELERDEIQMLAIRAADAELGEHIAKLKAWQQRDAMARENERLAAVEAENAELRAVLQATMRRIVRDGKACWCPPIFDDRVFHTSECARARALLSRQQPVGVVADAAPTSAEIEHGDGCEAAP